MSRLFSSRSVILVLTLSTFACTGEPTASPDIAGLDRETFIATYVDLRTAVIRGDTHDLSDQDRARILSDHGVTEEDLLGFAAAHGENVDFMRGVWDEVEARLDAVRLVPGSVDRR
jgi:hypothetical protein